MNLCLNEKKCIFRCTIAPFFGELVSRQVVKPDPKTIKAIQNLKQPKTKCELQSFLGMINYISKYTAEASQVCKPLRELISIRSDYKWHQHLTDAFNKAKNLVNKDCCLCYYNPNKSLFIETDASRVGLGVVLLQMDDKNMFMKRILLMIYYPKHFRASQLHMHPNH